MGEYSFILLPSDLLISLALAYTFHLFRPFADLAAGAGRGILLQHSGDVRGVGRLSDFCRAA